ncbi:MAG: hypothetical protein HYZ39_04350 [Mycolicibacterium cosmeticum]|nr:hypothetical protein [Mycolicibacterium cosmeticum]
MLITKENLRRLLQGEDDAVLVLREGRVHIVSAGDEAGGLEVISRVDLMGRLGDAEDSDGELAHQAAALDTAVSELGG